MSSEVEEIKNRLDIVDVIGEYVTLKPGGVNFKAVCPFHQEKTPSFMVNRDRQFWHCFGCDQGGDVFAFIQKIETMEFVEALKLLAQKAGVELKSYNPQTQSERTRLLDAHTQAVEFFHSLLWKPEGKQALDYLVNTRKLSENTIRAWKLGFALNEWRGLLGHLLSMRFTEKEIIASGLALSSQGRSYDRFRNRVMFPIVSLHGQVVGFSARALSADPNEPKYINSPQTLIYDKGNTLFGLFQARGSIREKSAAILVEGNMDVIASSQSGVVNCVAASGTGLTAGHLNLLSRFTKEVHFCFDADAAGLRAAERGITLALASGFFVKVIPLNAEDGKDPADIVEKDPSAWTRLVAGALPVMEYVLKRVARETNLRDVQEKKKAFVWLIGWLSKVQEPIERDFYVKKTASLLDLDESIIRKALQATGAPAQKSVSTPSPQHTTVLPRAHDVQLGELLLSLAVAKSIFFDYVIVHTRIEYLPESLVALYKILVSYYTIHKSLSDVQTLSTLLRQEHQQLEHAYLTLLAKGEEELAAFQSDELVFQELHHLNERLAKAHLEEEKKEFAYLIRQAEASGDREQLDALLEQFQAISVQLAQLDV